MLLQATYRVSLGLYFVGLVLRSTIALVVWRAASADAAIGGYDQAEFVDYFVVSLLWTTVVSSDLPWYLSSDVRRGRLASDLLRPVSPFLRYIGIDVAVLAQSLPIVVPTCIALHVVFDGSSVAPASVLMPLSILLPVALCVCYLLAALIACAALRAVRVDGLLGIHVLLTTFLGGIFAPIGVMPPALADLARALPYYWFAGFPVELAVGRVSVADAWVGGAVLLVWTCVLWVAVRWTWHRGLRAYESVGQ